MKADVIGQSKARIQEDEIRSLVALSKQNISHFEKIFDLYFLPIHNYILSKVRNRPVAEDLVSQTFLSALEGLPRYKEKGSFSAWIFTIARSKMNDFFRKNKYYSDKELPCFPNQTEDILANQIHIEELATLRTLIKKLPKKKMELIRLRYVAELSFRDIGIVLGKSEGAVKKALYRILIALKNELEKCHE